MRTTALAAVVVSLLLFPVGRGRAQSANLQGGIFFAPNSARRVTLTTNGEPLATFNIPKGTLLSASYDDTQPNSITAGRWEFHGEVALRAQPASAVQRRQPGKTLEQVMREAPLILSGQGMDVVVENVP
jgi:hypothetical protein